MNREKRPPDFPVLEGKAELRDSCLSGGACVCFLGRGGGRYQLDTAQERGEKTKSGVSQEQWRLQARVWGQKQPLLKEEEEAAEATGGSGPEASLLTCPGATTASVCLQAQFSPPLRPPPSSQPTACLEQYGQLLPGFLASVPPLLRIL